MVLYELVDHFEHFFEFLWVLEMFYELLKSTFRIKVLEFLLASFLFGFVSFLLGFKSLLGFQFAPLLAGCEVFAFV